MLARVPWAVLAAVGFLLFAAWVFLGRARGRDAVPYARRTDWSSERRQGIKYSAFTFRDRNRNGELDVGDAPLASILVEMTGPRGRRARRRSNLQGFANFEMSSSFWQWRAVIRRPGEYRFRVLVPPGWTPTADDVDQATEIEAAPGALAGLISRNPTRPVGLAPQLEISGRLARRLPGGELAPPGSVALGAVDALGREFPVPVDAQGSFALAVGAGTWRLLARGGESSTQRERTVVVGETPVRLATWVLDEPVRTASPRRTVVDFESVTGGQVAKIPSGTAGVEWTYLNAIESAFAEGAGYVNGTTSGHYVAYNSSGHPVTISHRGGFDFHGGFFGVGWPQAEGEALLVEAWRGRELVATDRVELSALGPVWFDADYRGVDRVMLRTLHYWQFVTDDLALGLPADAPAPARR